MKRRLPSTAICRKEVHRSYSTYYERAFARAGFNVDRVTELEGTDVRNLLPASDHLVFRLTPLTVPVARVSLLIKTCHMEWRTIERQVRHLVGQLERPGQFVEKVVVVDPWAGPFARQYERPDAVAHQEAMARLLGDGVIDRVVQAPTDPGVIRETYLRWFGTEARREPLGQWPAAVRHAVRVRLLPRRLRSPGGQRPPDPPE